MRAVTYQMILEACAGAHLDIFAALCPASTDGAPGGGGGTLLLLGPLEPGFWPAVSAAPEFSDHRPDPLDRWSTRVITALADSFAAVALFPFDGPPYLPFFAWALASGHAFSSPVKLMVHARAGLMVSLRGALALRRRIALPPPPTRAPCEGCAQPCLSSCPTHVLSDAGYDARACHAWLDSARGNDCLSRGCKVRRCCPASRTYGRLEAQSAFHMKAFHHP